MASSRAARESGFTLIELLVVISIIAILSGLLMAGAFSVRTRAKVGLTSTRLGAVTTGLAHAASERDLVAVLLVPPNDFAVGLPAAALRDTPLGVRQANGGAPQNVALRDFFPDRSLDLLFHAGSFAVQPDRRDSAATATARAAALSSYENDRSPKQPWNDAWGQPLVVAYAYYNATSPAADTAFGYRRAFYVSVAAGGHKAAGTGTVTARLPAIWTQVNDVCNGRSTGTDRWLVSGTVNAFLNPPWTGIETFKQKSTGSHCALSAPQELR